MKFDCLKNEFEKIYNPKMVDYFLKGVSGFVTFENGFIHLFYKKSIKTSFCFGYGYGITFEEANAERKKLNEKENFIASNMENTYKLYDDAIKIKLYACRKGNSNLCTLEKEEYALSHDDKEHYVLTAKDKEMLEKELNHQKEMFLKRLETYWKKYGSSKLKTWTYLVD